MLAFLELGAKAVRHHDISEHNVNRLSKHLRETGLSARATSTLAGLVETQLEEESIDVVYNYGIVQHMSVSAKDYSIP